MKHSLSRIFVIAACFFPTFARGESLPEVVVKTSPTDRSIATYYLHYPAERVKRVKIEEHDISRDALIMRWQSKIDEAALTACNGAGVDFAKNTLSITPAVRMRRYRSTGIIKKDSAWTARGSATVFCSKPSGTIEN